MIKNAEILKKLEDGFMRDSGILPFNQALKLYTAMWKEGTVLGILPSANPLEGIEADIRIAKVLNSCLKNSCAK
jgi:hypothetical protein